MTTHAEFLPILPHIDVSCLAPFAPAPRGDEHAANYIYPAF